MSTTQGQVAREVAFDPGQPAYQPALFPQELWDQYIRAHREIAERDQVDQIRRGDLPWDGGPLIYNSIATAQAIYNRGY